jgi:hypothetical protein
MRKVIAVFVYGVPLQALVDINEEGLVNMMAARAATSTGRKAILGGGCIKVSVSKADAQRVADSRASEKARRAALKQVTAPDPIDQGDNLGESPDY